MKRPLILDVDGTFLKNDLTHEMILEAVKRDPLRAFRYARIGMRDKPTMKQEMVARIGDRLLRGAQPVEPTIMELARDAKAQGREVYLCSGSEASLVARLADQYDVLDGAFGTSPTYNMTSGNKAAFLEDQFPDGFDYAGNSTQDFAVWEAAQSAYGVRPPNGTAETTTAAEKPVHILVERPSPFSKLPLILRGFEIWKLLTVMLPLLIIAFLLGLTPGATLQFAVGVTLLFLARNIQRMLSKLHYDRERGGNAIKGNPIASGDLSVTSAVVMLVGLLAVGLPTLVTALI